MLFLSSTLPNIGFYEKMVTNPGFDFIGFDYFNIYSDTINHHC